MAEPSNDSVPVRSINSKDKQMPIPYPPLEQFPDVAHEHNVSAPPYKAERGVSGNKKCNITPSIKPRSVLDGANSETSISYSMDRQRQESIFGSISNASSIYMPLDAQEPMLSSISVDQPDIENTLLQLSIHPLCKLGHPLQWSNNFEPVLIACGACKKKDYGKNGCWNCPVCQCQICTSCYVLPKGVKPIEAKCKHVLFLNTEQETFNCVNCNGEYSTGVRRWTCSYCRLDLCQPCLDSLEWEVKSEENKQSTGGMSALEPNKCWEMHDLRWDIKIYSSKLVSCIRCRRPIICNEGRWRCSICQYDYCEVCKVPPE